ncbi:MAG: hypothetical protein COC15_02365 [Legionellales bacterium]|nr:MAG: hypothetical protein COC15_02365 [Legionellales bacterium]
MWFKRAKIFKLTADDGYDLDDLATKLAALEFRPCLPSVPITYGWVPPLPQEDATAEKIFAYDAADNCMLFCMQIEKKVLPGAVVRQELLEKIKYITDTQKRKVPAKERVELKEILIKTLLPKAFSKLSWVHAYIDIEKELLIVNATSQSTLEIFRKLFVKSVYNITLHLLEIKNISGILTKWLVEDKVPKHFTIESSCALVDPQQSSRTVRCKEQNLFADSMQPLLHDGYKVTQLSLTWKDNINFTLTEKLILQSIKYGEQLLEIAKSEQGETENQRFDANFMIMSNSLSELAVALIKLFAEK